MAHPFTFIEIAFRALKRIFTGQILHHEDVEIGGGLGVVSLLLKRERRSPNQYVVLVGRASGGVYYNLLELDEFDRFIESADDIRASQTCAIDTSLHAVPKLGHLTEMIIKGKVLRRVDTEILGGQVTVSLRLKRETATMHEYVVLATTALGWWQYYPFELDEFHRFVAAAKRIRAATGTAISDELLHV
jgi:molybdopterin-binding protein